MNGAHDLGGMHGFDPVDIESGKELFHAEWEKRVFAMTLACGFLGKWNIDQGRFARERMEPGAYLNSSYYEHWLHGLALLLVECGLLSQDELDRFEVMNESPLAVRANRVQEILSAGGPADCASETDPIFSVGDTVRVRNEHPSGHTRAPRFVRGRSGTVASYHGSHVLPDVSSQPEGVKQGAHLYNVRFSATELWGEGATSKDAVYVDVFEPYLVVPA
ncbi:MAG: nitrile hydratase subunit beta [Pseudomonadota bacterium]